MLSSPANTMLGQEMKRIFISIALAAAVIGAAWCYRSRSLTGTYNTFPTKQPAALRLNCGGTYEWGDIDSPNGEKETGKWWRIQGSVVVLLPDDRRTEQWFARVNKERSPFVEQVLFSTKLQEVMTTNSWIPATRDNRPNWHFSRHGSAQPD